MKVTSVKQCVHSYEALTMIDYGYSIKPPQVFKGGFPKNLNYITDLRIKFPLFHFFVKLY